jgi:hypothetical protein
MIRIVKVEKIAKRLEKEKTTRCRVYLKGTSLQVPQYGLPINLELEGDVIIARRCENEGRAICHKSDVYNIHIGIRLAVGRCINSMLGEKLNANNHLIKKCLKNKDIIERYQVHLKEYMNDLSFSKDDSDDT